MTHPVVKRDRFYMCAALGLILLVGYMGNEDKREQQATETQYAEMVCMWEADVAAGVPKLKADGHPNYDKRDVECPAT